MVQATERCAPEFVLDVRERYPSADDLDTERAGRDDEVASYYKRRSAGVWTGLATLTIALAVASVYGYTVLSQQDVEVEQIPSLAKSLPAISQHLGNIEKTFEVWRADQQNLVGQVHQEDASWKASLAQTWQQTDGLLASLRGNLLKQLNERSARFQAQMAQMASERDADRLRMSQLESQLAQARLEVDAVRSEYEREFASLREQQTEDHQELASLNTSLALRRVDFEIPKGQSTEVAPGLSFKLNKTDVAHQRFDGWLESEPENQKIWVQEQAIQRPVVFFPDGHDKALELIVTRVDQEGAVGYLLIPTEHGRMGPTELVSTVDDPSGLTTTTVLPVAQESAAGH